MSRGLIAVSLLLCIATLSTWVASFTEVAELGPVGLHDTAYRVAAWHGRLSIDNRPGRERAIDQREAAIHWIASDNFRRWEARGSPGGDVITPDPSYSSPELSAHLMTARKP